MTEASGTGTTVSTSASDALSTAKTDYVTNEDYDEEGSVSKAKAFVVACRKLLLYLPKRSGSSSGEEVEFDPKIIQEELNNAKRWLMANNTSGQRRTRYMSIEDYR